MTANRLPKDPYNIIIAGVGGQGNVMASRVFSNMLARKGFIVTIGETFGASQRGGSVMSHIRVSSLSTWSPQVPKGGADVIAALEPIEAIRVLAGYGNPAVKVLTNTRPIHPIGVITGSFSYPKFEEIKEALKKLSAFVWFIDATDEAVKLGNSILGNIIMLGALSAVSSLPVTREDFRMALSGAFAADKIEDNLKAFDLGAAMMKK